jgi:CBS domain-containing protein/uncharacterized protein (DUF2267 family)
MSLDRYRTHKVVMMKPLATVHEAACAMARHQIGSVLVGEHGSADGIVTDRDLALAGVAMGPDARTTLDEVMSTIVGSVDVNGSIEDVVQAMLGFVCRRVPITEDGRVVGIVTLDDLIADDAISTEALSSIVRTQLEVASLFGVNDTTDQDSFGREQRARNRHERRAENSFLRLIRAVQTRTGIATRERAAAALGIVLGAICQRLEPSDAKHLLAQLPYYLRQTLENDLVGPDRGVKAALVIDRLAKAFAVDALQAHDMLHEIGEVITESITAGELRLLRAHLPSALRDIFPERPATFAAQPTIT